MVRFNCPNCREPLEVDSGFRGSVARCDKCGALIHVPVKKGRRASAPIKRPKRPAPLTPGPAPEVPTARSARRRGWLIWLVAALMAVALIALALAALWLAQGRP